MTRGVDDEDGPERPEDDEPRPRPGDPGRSRSTVSGRRTLGPVARPGGRYSLFVGIAFLALIIVAFANMLGTQDSGILGSDPGETDLPLPEFAIPVAASDLEGDANIAQDDCETGELPCPPDARRLPACRIDPEDTIRVCDYFDRPLVISFWFTRGGDCELQQDVVDQVSRRFRGEVNFLSVNVRDDRETVRELVAERGWTMPVGHDRDGAVANIYRVGGCPTFLFAYPGGLLERAVIEELSAGDLTRRVLALQRESARRVAEG